MTLISRTHRVILASCAGTMVGLLAVSAGAQLANAIARPEPTIRTVLLPLVPDPTCVSQTGEVVPCPDAQSETRDQLDALQRSLADLAK